MSQAFPFSAIVGQDERKQAILLSAVDPSIGGVFVLGDRGTGKSTRGRNLLMWFRREQRAKLTWAGDPAKPMVDHDPLTLSPRRSFEHGRKSCAAPRHPGRAPIWRWRARSAPRCAT